MPTNISKFDLESMDENPLYGSEMPPQNSNLFTSNFRNMGNVPKKWSKFFFVPQRKVQKLQIKLDYRIIHWKRPTTMLKKPFYVRCSFYYLPVVSALLSTLGPYCLNVYPKRNETVNISLVQTYRLTEKRNPIARALDQWKESLIYKFSEKPSLIQEKLALAKRNILQSVWNCQWFNESAEHIQVILRLD